MGPEPEQFVIADLLANSIEPWDALTARELEALGARLTADSPLTIPVVIAAYRNERGPVLIDGGQRLQWLASPPRDRTVISADEVMVESSAIDEESAHKAAVTLHVNRRTIPSRVKGDVGGRVQGEFGWSEATIADVFRVSRPAVSQWFSQWGGADVIEVTGADGKTYPARGKQAEHDLPAAGDSISDALRALYADHEAVGRRCHGVHHIKVDLDGTTQPSGLELAVARPAAEAAA